MKRNIVYFGFALTLLCSCKDEESDLPESSFVGTYAGKHIIESFNFKDTLIISSGSNELDGMVTVTSKLLNTEFDGVISVSQVVSSIEWHDIAIDEADTILHAHGDVKYALSNNKLSQQATIDVETNILGYENPGKITLLGDFIKL